MRVRTGNCESVHRGHATITCPFCYRWVTIELGQLKRDIFLHRMRGECVARPSATDQFLESESLPQERKVQQ